MKIKVIALQPEENYVENKIKSFFLTYKIYIVMVYRGWWFELDEDKHPKHTILIQVMVGVN